jgi:hypothetical protein
MDATKCLEIGTKRSKVKMSLPMRRESLQQCTKGAPLTNYITPSHFNVLGSNTMEFQVPIVKTKIISISNLPP